MLDLLLSKNESSFSQLEIKLRQIIRRQVAPFARDKVLRKTEDVDSLYNIALCKLHEALMNFVYEPSLEPVHNERRFLAMVILYVKNAMIDLQYAENARKRMPLYGIISLDQQIVDPTHEEMDRDGLGYDPQDLKPSADQIFHEKDVHERICMSLDEDERQIYTLLRDGHSPEGIAGKLGVLISRVRHTIYERIQRSASRFFPQS